MENAKRTDVRPLVRSAPKPLSRRPTMRDVARLADVSHQTVSRVVNGDPGVREDTRRHVLDAMCLLNYRRNSVARALVTHQSHTVGVVGLPTTLFGPASVLHGIEEAAEEVGYVVSVATVRDPDTQQVREAVDRMIRHGVDGLIAIAPKPAVVQALAQGPAGSPCVVVGASGEPGVIPAICLDNAAGARTATEHLLDLGHPTVHHAAGPLDWPEAQERLRGWCAAIEASGRPLPHVAAGSWDEESGYRQGRPLAADGGVTAIFCANDRIALGVLRALHEAGRRIPADVSVVGFDDIPTTEYFPPPLTTVRQDFRELGRRSVSMLLDLMDGPDDGRSPGQVLVAPELIVRASSGPAPGLRHVR